MLAFVAVVVAAVDVVDIEVLDSTVALPAVHLVVVVKMVVLVRSNRSSAAARWELGRLRPLIDYGHSPCSCNLACRTAVEVAVGCASEIGCR